MSSLNISGSDPGLVSQTTQFKNAMNTYGGTLGFDAAVITQVVTAMNAFPTAYNASEAAKNAAKGAVSAKDDQRRATVAVMRDFAQQIKNNPEATPEILASFGIVPSPTPSGSVSVPVNLTATAFSNGTALLKWGRNGNIQGTVFVIESRYSEGDPWLIIGTSTRARFTDNQATPGVMKAYRIRAERGGVASAYSDDAVIYAFQGGNSLSIAA